VESLERRYAFGAGLDLELLGFELDDSTLVPGVAVESSRAKPLAGKFVSRCTEINKQCEATKAFKMFIKNWQRFSSWLMLVCKCIYPYVQIIRRGGGGGGGPIVFWF
jgi:hypothetical protein